MSLPSRDIPYVHHEPVCCVEDVYRSVGVMRGVPAPEGKVRGVRYR